jgi:hypothetical protein
MKPLPPPVSVSRYFDAAIGREVEVRDYRGAQHHPPRPERLECDYCMCEVDRLYCVPTRPFGFLASPDPREMGRYVYYGGTWNACEECHPFVVARIPIRLALRVVRVLGRGYEAAYPMFSAHYEVVFACAAGPELVWRAGDAYPLDVSGVVGPEVSELWSANA